MIRSKVFSWSILLLTFSVFVYAGGDKDDNPGTPPDDDPPGEENCDDVCKRAIAGELHKKVDPVNGGYLYYRYGLVVCCNGEPYPCLFEVNWPASGYPPGTNSGTPDEDNVCLKKLRECNKAHEQGHIDYGAKCDGSRTGAYPASIEEEDDDKRICMKNQTECQEYEKQEECLKALALEHGGPCGNAQVAVWLLHVLNNKIDYGCQGGGLPKPSCCVQFPALCEDEDDDEDDKKG